MAIVFNIGEAVKLSEFNVLQEPIQMLMNGQMEQWEQGSKINTIFVMRNTSVFQEEFRSSTSMDGFKPTEDLEVAHISDFEESYGKIFRTQIWTNSFVISKQAIEDNQSMSINTRVSSFIKSYNRTREMFAFTMLAGALKTEATFEGKTFDTRGADTVDGTIDGVKQRFFFNAHKGAGDKIATQSNRFYVDGGINLGAAAATAKLTDIIGQVQSAMMNYTDDKGNILCVNPDTIIIPNHYSFSNALLTALKTDRTAAMGTNAVNLMANGFKVIITPYLNQFDGFKESDQAFIMMDSGYNKEVLGALWLDRVPLTVKSYIDDATEANVWKGRSRYSAGFNNFRAFAYCATGATLTGEGGNKYCTKLTPKPLDGGVVLTQATA